MSSPFLAPDRDPYVKLGRWDVSTSLSLPGVVATSTTTRFCGFNRDKYAPLVVQSPVIVSALYMEVVVGVAATNMRFGLYAADTNWQAFGAPLADSGNVSSASTGVKTYTPGTPLYLPPGRYLTVDNCDDASNTVEVRCLAGSVLGSTINSALGANPLMSQWYASRTYAAFPTPGAASTTNTNAATPSPNYAVFLRLSAP